MNTRIVVPIVIVLLLASLYPSIRHTYAWAGDAHGLILLAASSREEFRFNPYARNGVLITPGMAVWLLDHLEYPYSRCVDVLRPVDVCEVPLVMWAGRELGMGAEANNTRIYTILQLLIARGEPVNELHEGFTAIHEAILFDQPAYLELLLDAGGDPLIRIQQPGKEFDGYDARQFHELIKARRGNEMEAIGEILDRHRARQPA